MDTETTDSPTAGELGPLATALLHEHHAIDRGIEAFTAHSSGVSGASGVSDAAAKLQAWFQPLREAMTALRRHIYLEEEIVFPSLRTGGLMMALMVMVREHAALWQAMDNLDAQLDAIGGAAAPANSAPSDAALSDAAPTQETIDALIADCRAMLSLLDDHNSKEEPVIYPHIDADADPETLARLAEFLDSGHMPEGWVCQGLAKQ
ncbi:hemerythrin domain-containing protein [Microbacterium sp. YY-01]|uniref:hemerythrin domain-containing protein n=1 Tax=Microbacterium sp. YY-01 TaxID=3421634 RepID=UPI003D1626D4